MAPGSLTRPVTQAPQRRLLQFRSREALAFPLVPGDCFQLCLGPPPAPGDRPRAGVMLPPVSPFSSVGWGPPGFKKAPK